MPDPIRQRLRVNGADVDVESSASDSLLDVLRRDLGLTGAKAGCERGECGTCTVLLGDDPVMACVVPAGLVDRPVTTIEGLADSTTTLREAFADRGGQQCGFCTPGQVVRAVALLRAASARTITLDEATIRHEMSGNICRCTGYTPIVDAVLAAAVDGERR